MNLSEIAILANVSKTTVSYVINGKADQYRISKKTQQKVMEVVKANNYHPNFIASTLRRKSTHSFGLIIPDLDNISFTKLAKLLENKSRQAGYQLLIGCSDDDIETEQDVATTLTSRCIDALFVASCLPNASEYYSSSLFDKTPIIAIDRLLDDEFFACIVSEDFTSAYRLTNSLLNSDIKSVALIGALPQLAVSKERQLGFEKALNEYNCQSQIFYGEHFSRDTGAKLMQKLIKQNRLPDAIVVTSYSLLEGVLDILLTHPELMDKFKIASFGNHRLLDFLPIKINSLEQEFDQISGKAIEIALEAIQQKNYQKGVITIPRYLHKRD